MSVDLMVCHEFEIFQLPLCYSLSLSELRTRYQALMREHHPDQLSPDAPSQITDFATLQLRQQQIASRVNHGFDVLRDPLKRAQCLLTLCGFESENHKRDLPAEFLAEQITWRERIEETPTPSALMLLAEEIADHERQCESKVAEYFLTLPNINVAQATAIGQTLRQWMFWRKLAETVDEQAEAGLH